MSAGTLIQLGAVGVEDQDLLEYQLPVSEQPRANWMYTSARPNRTIKPGWIVLLLIVLAVVVVNIWLQKTR